MFFVSDSQADRHQYIRNADAVVALLLSAADFEWTLRRAILALGCSPTKEIRLDVLGVCSGLDAYKKAWQKEVKPRLDKTLPDVIEDWSFLKTQAYPLRHRLVHGIRGSVGEEYARERVESFLNASQVLVAFATSKGEKIYGKRIVRYKRRIS